MDWERFLYKKKYFILLILSVLFLSFPYLIHAVSSWIETDWTGQSGTSVTTGSAMTLSTTESFANTGFETNLTGWSNTNSYTLNDEFTTNLPTTLVSGTATLTNAGVITPTGTEVLTDGALDNWTTSTNLTSWTENMAGTSTVNQETTTVRSGSAVKLTIDASNSLAQVYQSIAANKWYLFSAWSRALSGTPSMGIGSNLTGSSVKVLSTTYSQYFASGHPTAADLFILKRNSAASNSVYFDDASVTDLTFPSLLSTVDTSQSNVVISTDVTLTSGTQAGIVMNLDNPSNPQNFVLAYHDGTNIHLVRVVGGQYQTENINTASSYGAGTKLKVIKSGNSYTLMYGTTNVGTATISDAGITGNTIHGLFSTLSTNSFANFLVTTNINGTSAEPTGGTRTVVDTESKLTIANNKLTSSGGITVAAWGNPGIWYPSTARGAGKVLFGSITPTAANRLFEIGFDIDTTLQSNNNALAFNTDGSLYAFGNESVKIGDYAAGTNYQTAIVLRSTGAYFFIKGGIYTDWTLIHISAVNTTNTLYPAVNDYNAAFTADNVRIPTDTWLPTPLVSDGFSAATTDGSGHAEANGGSGLTWTGATWTVSGGKVTNSPTLGTDLWDAPAAAFDGTSTYGWAKFGSNTIANVGNKLVITYGDNIKGAYDYFSDTSDLSSNLTIGNWYGFSVDANTNAGGNLGIRLNDGVGYLHESTITSTSPITIPLNFYTKSTTGAFISANNMGTGETLTLDNLSLKPLTLASLFRSTDAGSADVIADTAINLTSGTQGGIVARLNDADNPASFVIAYIDGTNAKVDEYSGGTYTNRISAAATPVADGVLRLVLEGANARLYYNNVLIGTSAALTVTTGTRAGLFSTYSGNNFDNFVVWPRNGYAVPDVDLTSTRDTGTKYAGNASAKLVAGTNDANFTQSVNVGDTRTHTLTAYAYTGSAVTTDDLDLYYNTAAIATTFTDMGNNWYKLTGTVTGENTARDVGVRVHSGKTVYVDNMSFADYDASGNFTSTIKDTGSSSNWGTLTYTLSTPANTTATIKVRSSNSATMTGAPDFSTCNAVTSGTDISSNNCVTDTHRYVQYYVAFTSTTGANTPTLSDITLTYANAVPPTGSININAGATYTNSQTVTLTLSSSDDVDSGSGLSMMIGNDASFTGSVWETFSASKSWTVTSTDGTKTVYVKYKDSSDNESPTYSDTIVLDTTAPAAFDLDSPGADAYTNNTRPTFRWKISSDAGSGLSKYRLDLDNGDTGDITIDNIPEASDETTGQYVIDYDNGYIAVYTKSSSSWTREQNDGALKEGKRTWTVTVWDVAGNSRSASRTLYVDLTAPTLTSTITGTDTAHPTITGTITDNYSIDKLQVSYYKQTIFLGIVLTETLISQENLNRTSTNSTSSTHWDYVFTTSAAIPDGTYKVEMKAFDSTGNSTTNTSQIVIGPAPSTPSRVVSQAPIATPTPTAPRVSLPEMEKQAFINRQQQAELFNQLVTNIGNFLKQKYEYLASLCNRFQRQIASIQLPTITLPRITWPHLVFRLPQIKLPTLSITFPSVVLPHLAINLPHLQLPRFKLPTIALNVPKIQLPSVRLPHIVVNLPVIKLPQVRWMYIAINLPKVTLPHVTLPTVKLPKLAIHVPKVQLPEVHVPSVTLPTMRVTTPKTAIVLPNVPMKKMQEAVTKTQANAEQGRQNIIKRVGEAMNLTIAQLQRPVIQGKSLLAKAKIIYDTAYAILFDKEPTRISEVTIKEIGRDYAIVTFKTNHPAWGKINYGPTLSYGSEVLLKTYEYVHTAKLTGLTPGGTYFFEVMAQNKNYTYDAYYTIEVPK